MTTEEKREVVRVLKHLVGPAFKAVLGRGDGTINVAGRPGYVWCRKLGREELLITAFNRSGATAEGTTVLVRPRTLEGLAEYEVVDPLGAAGTTTTLSGHIAQEPFDAHLNNPACRVYRSTDQSINTATWTPISFSHERFDTDNIWVIGAPTRLTCQTAGIYTIMGHASVDASVAGDIRGLDIRLSNTTVIATNMLGIDVGFDGLYPERMQVSTIYALSVGNYIELRIYHDIGVAQNTETLPNYVPEFMMARIG